MQVLKDTHHAAGILASPYCDEIQKAAGSDERPSAMGLFKQKTQPCSRIPHSVPAQASRDASDRVNDETPPWPQGDHQGFKRARLAFRTLKLWPKLEPCPVARKGASHLPHITLEPRSLAPCECGRTAAWQGPHVAGLLGMLLLASEKDLAEG